MINPQKGIDLINNDSIINRILFAVIIFQHAFVEGELHLVMNAIVFLAHSLPFTLSFISFDLSLLCFKEIVEGHCPSLMTRGQPLTLTTKSSRKGDVMPF